MHVTRNRFSHNPRRSLSALVQLGLFAIAVSLIAVFPAVTLAVDEPSIVAESAIVVDAETGEVLLDHNASEARAMASLTKLITALVALEMVSLDTKMVVEQGDLVGEASMGLAAGETVRFETLLHGLMLPSGNDAASTVARVAGGGSQADFIARANQRITELGLHHTHLANPHGLDAEGHYSSARDIAAVTMYALQHQPAITSAIHTPSYAGDGFTLYNTNRLLNTYPGIIGGKTGVTDAAGYCLMQVAEIDGRTVLVVLMGSTWESWYADAERLLDYGFEALATPGRVSSGDAITFPSTAPQVIAETTSHTFRAISVAQVSADARVVTVPQIAALSGWSPWFWVGAVVVLVPSLSYIALQIQKLLTLIAYGPPRRRAQSIQPAAAGPTVMSNASLETQPFPLVTATNVSAPTSYQRWAHFYETPPRRPSVGTVREVVPSTVGD